MIKGRRGNLLLTIPEQSEVGSAVQLLDELMEQANTYIKSSKASNTVKGYRSDWEDFANWCTSLQRETLPATEETFALYIANLASNGYKASTIERRISSVSQAHQAAGYNSPTSYKIKQVMAGVRRLHGSKQKGKNPILVDHLKKMALEYPDTLAGYRDSALLLIGFSGAFRRSELVSLDVEHVERDAKGLIIHLEKSKVDQEGKGDQIGIPYGSYAETCPVLAYDSWVKKAAITSGALFRPINRHGHVSAKRLSDQSVALIVKRYAGAIGLVKDDYAGHSLRSGLATSAAMAGKGERTIMKQTRHSSEAMLRKYIRMGTLFSENAASNIGL